MRLITTTSKVLLLTILISVSNLLSVQAFATIEELKDTKIEDIKVSTLISVAQNYYKEKEYEKAGASYQEILAIGGQDSLSIYKQLAFTYAKAQKPLMACSYIEKYIKESLDVSFVGHSYFEEIKDSIAYQKLSDKYLQKINFWAVFYFCVGFLGFFIAIVLNLRKRSDKIANLLMGAFVLTHSFFMIHISLFIMNYSYYVPHILYVSTIFSFLYGPLIYFYFKRVTSKYRFVIKDIVHLIPTVLLLVFLVPIYNLSAEEKLTIIIQDQRPYMAGISAVKLISLLVYGVLVIRLYLKFIRNNTFISRVLFVWQRNIVIFCSVYIVAYTIYSFLISQSIYSGFLFSFQVTAMAVLVLYVSYTAFVQPSIFGKLRVIKGSIDSSDITSKTKYNKSGLTPSLSIELKNKLIHILNEEKVYKQNNITLHKLSELLDTTRHNTSQIINEHFGLNFFELINSYRIEEAKQLLIEVNKRKNLSIIDVAYEVGFNNKVTFNKSFKKYNQVTPSEYIKSFVA